MGLPASPRDPASIRLKLHTLNGQLASTTNPLILGSLLRQYISVTDELFHSLKGQGGAGAGSSIAGTALMAAPFIPGGAIISAAISGSSGLGGGAGGMGGSAGS